MSKEILARFEEEATSRQRGSEVPGRGNRGNYTGRMGGRPGWGRS